MTLMKPTWDANYLQRVMQDHAPHADWLASWQQDELSEFVAQGVPNRKQETWKYTNVAELAPLDFAMPAMSDANIDIEPYQLSGVYQMVFVDGCFSESLSNLDGLPNGVIAMSMQAALSQHEQLLQPHLFQKDKAKTQFYSLNAALLTDGLFLYVPANVTLDKPIHMLYCHSDHQQKLMTHPRHVIIAKENSECSVFEQYVGTNQQTYFNNIVTEIVAMPGSRVTHYKLQCEGERAYHIANIAIQQARDSLVKTLYFAIGGKLARDDLSFDLAEQGANCELYGYYHLLGHQYIDSHTRVDHRASDCTSKQNYKGILDGATRGVFNGKVIVHEGTKKSNAMQANNNLLLSTQADMNTKPELEIYAEDVQCSHGATVGQIDESALFYLRSRGVDADKAQHLLTCGFAGEIVDLIANKEIALYVKQHVTKRLANAVCQGECANE